MSARATTQLGPRTCSARPWPGSDRVEPLGGSPCRPGSLPGLPLQQDPDRDALRTPASEQLDSEMKVDVRLPGECPHGALAVPCPAELVLPPAHYLVRLDLADLLPSRRCHRFLPFAMAYGRSLCPAGGMRMGQPAHLRPKGGAAKNHAAYGRRASRSCAQLTSRPAYATSIVFPAC